jgi:hypothetical protein
MAVSASALRATVTVSASSTDYAVDTCGHCLARRCSTLITRSVANQSMTE